MDPNTVYHEQLHVHIHGFPLLSEAWTAEAFTAVYINYYSRI